MTSNGVPSDVAWAPKDLDRTSPLALLVESHSQAQTLSIEFWPPGQLHASPPGAAVGHDSHSTVSFLGNLMPSLYNA